jgi:hypothetical protein
MPITDEVAVKLVADIEDLIRGLKTAQSQTKESLDKIEESSASVAEAFEGLKHTVIGALEASGVMLVYEAMERVKDMVDETAARFIELRSTAEAFQTSVDTLEGLHYAVEELGDSGYKADIAMRMLSMRMQAARDGSREAQDALLKVGIGLKELRDPAFNGMEALIRVAQSTADFSEKASLLGRNGYAMKDVLDSAAQGSEALQSKFHELGGTTDEQIQKMADYHKAIFDIETRMTNFKSSLAVAVMPAIKNTAEALDNMFSKTGAGQAVMTIFTSVVNAGATALIYIGGALAEASTLITEFGEHLAEVVIGTQKIAAALTSSFNPATILKNVEAAWNTSWENQKRIAQDASDKIVAIENEASARITDIWTARDEKKINADKPTKEKEAGGGGGSRDVKPWQDPELEMLKFRMAMLHQGNLEDADERIRLAQQIAAREIETSRGSVAQQLAGLAMIEQAVRANKALRDQMAKQDVANDAAAQLAKVEEERRLLEFRYSMLEISSGELLAGRKSLAQRELEIETEKYNKLAELDRENSAARKRNLDSIAAAVRASDAKIIAAQQEASKQMKALWTNALHPVVSEFGNAFKSMINATASFKGAMQNLYVGLVNHFEDVVIQMAEKWIVGELMKTTATAVGAETRTAITEEEVLLSIGKKIWEGLKWIAVEAGKAFAGAYAAIAGIPYVGPVLAPVAAAAAGVAVVGGARALFAEQGYLVPNDTAVNVHKDEMILPAHLSKGVQEMIKNGGSGGPPVNVHIHAMDGMSVERVLRANPDAVYRAVRGAVNRKNKGFVK